MAKVSKGAKQKAVIGASKAAFDSISMFAGAIGPVSQQAAASAQSSAATAERLIKLFAKAFEVEPPEPPPAISPQEELKQTTDRIKKQSFDIAALGLVIPLLINPQAREYLYSFVKGLVGEDAFDKVKYGVTGVLSVLAGVFTYKVFKQVGDTITAMKKLAKVTSVLFGLAEAGTEDALDKEVELDKEKKKVEEDRKRREADDKKVKDAAKKGRDDIKTSKQEYKKAGTLGKIRFLATKFGPKVLGAVIKSIPFVGAAATIGLLVADIAGFFSDDEEEKESKPESKPSAAASAPAAGQSPSDLPKEAPPAAASESKPSAAASKPPADAAPVKAAAPAAAPETKSSVTDADLEKLIKQKNEEYEAKDAAVRAESEKKMAAAPVAEVKPSPAATVDDFQKTPEGKSLPEGVTRDRNSGAYVFGENMFVAGNDEAFYALLKSFKTGERVEYVDDDRNAGKVKVAFDPKNGKEILGPATGADLSMASEEVGSKKKQAKTSVVIVNNIDNSTVVKKAPPPPQTSGGQSSYSTSVGM